MFTAWRTPLTQGTNLRTANVGNTLVCCCAHRRAVTRTVRSAAADKCGNVFLGPIQNKGQTHLQTMLHGELQYMFAAKAKLSKISAGGKTWQRFQIRCVLSKRDWYQFIYKKNGRSIFASGHPWYCKKWKSHGAPKHFFFQRPQGKNKWQ